MPTPSTWQTTSAGLKRAGDPDYKTTTLGGGGATAVSTTWTIASASAGGIIVGSRVQVDDEIVHVTVVNSNTSITVTRAQEGTTAVAHNGNSVLYAYRQRVAGLELSAEALDGSWPTLQVRGGVRVYAPGIVPVSEEGNGGIWPFQSLSATSIGSISIPSETAGAITETSDWSFAKLSYASQMDVTFSRLTPAILIETSKTALRLCSGTVTKRTTNGAAITETASQPILPKYVAYHTAAGYQVAAITTSNNALTGIDQPWIMVWFGSNYHWVDTTKPINYSSTWITGRELATRYASQCDAPLLLTFSHTPTNIVRDVTAASGFDLTLPVGAKKISVLPLYGRTRPAPATTETWSTPANLPQAQIAAWYPRLGQFPASAAESYGWVSDTATTTRTITWTQVLSSGSVKFCPLPPFLGVTRDLAPTGLAVTGTVVDGSIPTEYGPTQGVTGVNSVAWTYAGLAAYTTPRAALGAGAVPSALTTRLNAAIDTFVAQAEWEPWGVGSRIPQQLPGGDIYWANSADTLALGAEIAASASGSRRTNLLSWLTTYAALRPPETGTNYAVTSTNGTERGPFGVPGTHQLHFDAGRAPWHSDTDRRQSLWAAWGYARYYQETGVSVVSGVVDDLVDLIDIDMAEHDAATWHWLGRQGIKQTAVENVNRHIAGLVGLAWLCDQVSHADEGLVRALLAQAVVTRLAMAHLPRWQASAGLITIPTDLGSPSNNAFWMSTNVDQWMGFEFTTSWATSADDPRQVIKCDQFHPALDDTNFRFGWNEGGTRGYQPPYRCMVKPLADLLADVTPTEAAVYADVHRELNPHWYIPFADGTLGGEAGYHQPMDTYGMFLTRAWIEAADAPTLEREAAYPWIDADLFGMHKLAEAVRAYAGDSDGIITAPQITDVDDNLSDYASSQLPLYSPLIVTCQVATAAEREVYLPYDAAAPHANDRNGITVDLQISTDPAFGSYQTAPFVWIEEQTRTTKTVLAVVTDHVTPTGAGYWRAGWQPETSTGTYYYRVRAMDAIGVTVVDGATITVVAALAGRRGGIRVSPDDPRYFEHADGTYFSGMGAAFQPRSSLPDNVLAWHIPHIQAFATGGVKWSRLFASRWAIWGDYQPEFASGRGAAHNFPFNSQLNANPSYPVPSGGPEYVAYSSDYSYPLWGYLRNGISVERSTTYRVQAEVAITAEVSGPLVGGDSFGLCFKHGLPGSTFPIQQVSYGGQTVWWPIKPGNGTVVGPSGGTFVTGPTAGGTWEVIDFGTFTTASTQDFIGYFYPVLQSTGSPTQPAWIRRIWLQKDLGGGNYGPNLIGVHPSDMHKQINQRFADGFDHMIAAAEDEGLVFKVVMIEKENYGLGTMNTSGGMSLSWSQTRFWGTTGSRQRWLHAAIARYFQGRWGYSPAVTWEFVNEGDPGADAPHLAANNWALTIASFANPRPTTTSTSSTSYRYDKWQLSPALTSGDFHGYQRLGVALTIPTTGAPGGNGRTIATAAEYYDVAGAVVRTGPLGAQGAFGIGKPATRGEMGWYPGDSADVVQPMTSAARIVLLHKLLWAHLDPGGVLNHIWHSETYVYDPVDASPNNLAEFSRLATFMDALPVNQGGYTDAAATSSHASLRAIGQKNATTNRCHVWVDNAGTSGDLDNAAHNWRTVDASLTPTARSGTISVPGLGANVSGTLYTYNTYTGVEDAGVPATVSGAGVLAISVSSLSTDVAYRFEPLGAPPAPGGAPTNVLAAAGINEVTVSWDVPTGWVTAITAYEIEVRNVTAGTVSTQSTPNVLVWPITGLSPGIVYSFRVRAYSGAVVGGYSVASEEVTVVALGSYLKDEVLNWFKGADMDAAPATVYWSLHTGDPGKTGASEVSTSSTAYARVSMATTSGFSAIADGTGTKRRVTNAGAITFAVPIASWGTVTYAGCWDALTSGNFLGGGILAQEALITVPQDAAHFNTGQLAVELD